MNKTNSIDFIQTEHVKIISFKVQSLEYGA